MCTEKSSPASCAPVTERQFASRDRARPVRQGCCPLARLVIYFQTLAVTQQGLQRLALRRVFRQGLLPCLRMSQCRSQDPVAPRAAVCSFAVECCSRLALRPYSSPIRFTQGLMSGRPRKSRRTPAIGEHEVIRQLPGQLLVSGARYTGSAETSEQLLRRRCAAGRVDDHPYSVLANPEPAAGILAFLAAGVNPPARLVAVS